MENQVSFKEHPMYTVAIDSIAENFSVEQNQAIIIFDSLAKEQQELILYYKQQLAQANNTVNSALSAAEEFRKKLNLGPSLSGGFTAYDRLRWQYLEPSYVPKSVDDVPYPKFFDPNIALQEIYDISLDYGRILDTQLKYLSAGIQEGATSMYTVSCEGGGFVIDKERMKKHFEFLEFVRHIDMQTVANQPVTTGMKVVSEFIQTYKY